MGFFIGVPKVKRPEKMVISMLPLALDMSEYDYVDLEYWNCRRIIKPDDVWLLDTFRKE